MSYLEQRHYEQLPSARERIATIRAKNQVAYEKAIRTNEYSHGMVSLTLERFWFLDLADILLDAMRDGPDMGRVIETAPEGNKS